MEKAQRNTLRNAVTQCRKLLETAIGERLQGRYGIHPNGVLEEAAYLAPYMAPEEQVFCGDLVAHLEHIQGTMLDGGAISKAAVEQLVREIGYTHLNRLCAYKMLERRQLIREAVGKGLNSAGFKFYLADHPDDEALWSGGQQETAYQHFLTWLGAELSSEVGALFLPSDPANRLYPPHAVLEKLLALVNGDDLHSVWDEDETLGWVYQYFTPKELRDQAREESAAPRNAYEMSFRNQFYTPRYVVQFLVDNTLGRLWYEMRHGNTALVDRCRLMVRRRHPIFLGEGEERPRPFRQGLYPWAGPEERGDAWIPPPLNSDNPMDLWFYALTIGYPYVDDYFGGPDPNHGSGPEADSRLSKLTKERWDRYRETGAWEGTFRELRLCLFQLQRLYHWDVYMYKPEELEEPARALLRAIGRRWDLEVDVVEQRPKRDPRDITLLDPACGSGHFLLYAFDVLQTIYEEAWTDPDLGPTLRREYGDANTYRRATPGLILQHNLHGIDIDLRSTQITGLALWLRAQRAYQESGIKTADRPKITRANVVCAEPMPGETDLLKEFASELQPRVLGQLAHVIFTNMKLAGDAGSLLKIECDMREAIAEAKRQWRRAPQEEQVALWPDHDKKHTVEQLSLFDVAGITDEAFWDEAEGRLREALKQYAEHTADSKASLRRLFSDDAAQGLGYIDLCRERFDVVLMNPPFGEASKPSKAYVEKAYPRTKHDVYAAFVERGLAWLRPRGMLGAITSRTGFFLSSFQKWREEVLIKESRLTALADLGVGVLDSAMVETAAYVLERAVAAD